MDQVLVYIDGVVYIEGVVHWKMISSLYMQFLVLIIPVSVYVCADRMMLERILGSTKNIHQCGTLRAMSLGCGATRTLIAWDTLKIGYCRTEFHSLETLAMAVQQSLGTCDDVTTTCAVLHIHGCVS